MTFVIKDKENTFNVRHLFQNRNKSWCMENINKEFSVIRTDTVFETLVNIDVYLIFKNLFLNNQVLPVKNSR